MRNWLPQFDDARDAVLGEKAAQMRARKRAAQGARRLVASELLPGSAMLRAWRGCKEANFSHRRRGVLRSHA